jgi:hypothetical protein
MCPRSETTALVQKRLWVEGILGAVEGNGRPVVNLNRVGAVVRPDRPVDFDVGTCLVIRERVLAKCVRIITLKPSVNPLTHEPMR